MSLTPEQQLQKIEAMKAYHNTPGINSTLLRKLQYGPREYLAELNKVKKADALYFEESESLIIGNGVDMKMTVGDYGFLQAFFHPQLQEKPSPKVMSIMQEVYDNIQVENLDDVTDDQLAPVMVAQGYRAEQNWGAEARLRNIRKEGGDYFRSLALCKGRQILSSEELVLIGQMSDNLQSSSRIMKWLQPEDPEVTVETQSIIFFEHRGYACKAMLDAEWANHNLKIARPIDVKTTKEEVLNFPAAVRRWRYDLQGTHYCNALKAKYPDYQILPPVFLVESSTNPGFPMDFELDEDVVHCMNSYRSPSMVTLKELFMRLDWYTANGFEKHYLETDKPVKLGMEHLSSRGLAMNLHSELCGEVKVPA